MSGADFFMLRNRQGKEQRVRIVRRGKKIIFKTRPGVNCAEVCNPQATTVQVGTD